MANVNYLKASSNTPYTGIAKRKIPLGLLQGIIALPRGTRYTQSQFATLPATLIAAARQNPLATRVFPIGPFIAFNDKSSDSVLESTDYGYGEVVRDGTYIWQCRTGYGGLDYYENLRKFQSGAYDMVFIYKRGIMLTYAPNSTSGADEATGVVPSLIHVPIWKAASGSTAEQFMFEVQIFDAAQIADNFLFIETDFNLMSQIKGILQVDLQNSAVFNSSPAGAIDVDPIAMGDSTDRLIDTYGSTLNNTTLWTALNDETLAGITITGVSMVNNKYRVQLDTTDTDYPASTHKVRLSMATNAVLFAAGVEGYESNSVSITRP